MKGFKNKFIIILLILSLGSNVYLLTHRQMVSTSVSSYKVSDPDKTIKEIEAYLDSISDSYIKDEQFLAKENKISSWGCGPSSYALAKIINKKFFDDKLVIDASYNNKDPYEIIERFSLAIDNNQYNDHGWLEIYLGDKFLFVDPSIGQFGKIHKIAYQIFDVEDPNIKSTLKSNYNIEDVRLSLLIPKAINRIPTSQEPYPGMTIRPDSLDYYLKILEDRNSVNDGIEPADWKDWVSFLTNKYLGTT
jgi:hypothetical protein